MPYIKNLSEYIEQISERNSEWNSGELLYRGHEDRAYKAEPSVLRSEDWKQREHEMIRELLAEHPEDFSRDLSTFEWLARAQHYGLPTRLLDVTKNPLVALYFACLSVSSSSSETLPRRPAGEVIVFNPISLRKRFFDSESVAVLCNLAYLPFEKKNSLRKHLLRCREDALRETTDGSEEDFNKAYVAKFNANSEIREILRLANRDNPSVGDTLHPDDLSQIVAVLPRKLDVRIASQSGAFLIFGLFNPEREGIFAERKRSRLPTRHFLKNFDTYEIYVAPKNKNGILSELDSLGINEEALFPSLERTAAKIKRRGA